jgi:hypothetical protein
MDHCEEPGSHSKINRIQWRILRSEISRIQVIKVGIIPDSRDKKG